MHVGRVCEMKIKIPHEIEINGEDVECVVVFDCTGVDVPPVVSGPLSGQHDGEGPEVDYSHAYRVDTGEKITWTVSGKVARKLLVLAAEKYLRHIKGGE